MAQADRAVILSLIDSAANQAEKHYSLYTLALLGAFARVLSMPEPSSPRSRSSLEGSANALQVALVTQLNDLLVAQTDDLLARAIKDANPLLGDEERERLAALVVEARDQLMSTIIVLALNDATAVLRAWRQFAFRVEAKVAAGVSRQGASLTLSSMMLNAVRFQQADRAGRRWDTTLYARTSVRGCLLWSYVEPFLLATAALPQDVAMVSHDEDHENDGLMFSINGATEHLMTFADIRDEIFHPNSRALVSQP